MLEFRWHFWRKINQVEGNIVLLGKAIEDGGCEFIAGKLWIKDNDTFSGESTLPEHHGCGYTFARAGRAHNLDMGLSHARPRRVDRFKLPVNVPTYKDA